MSAALKPFHVGLAPYIDAFGDKRASYQTLNDDGEAIGTVDIVNGKTGHLCATADCDVGSLIHRAKEHFARTPAITFGTAVNRHNQCST